MIGVLAGQYATNSSTYRTNLYTVTVIPGIPSIGEDRKKERDEREWEIIQVKFLVNKTTVHSIRKLNAHVIKKKKMQT